MDSGEVSADADISGDGEDLDQFLGQLISAFGTPGISVAAWRDDTLVGHVRGHSALGVRDLSLDDRFPIGCVIKPLVALLCCELHVRGAIDIAKSISHYLPQFERAGTVTVEDLLSHTAGYVEPSGANDRFMMTWEEFEQYYRNAPQAFAPGRVWSYCQTGFCILGKLVETVLGRDIEEVVDTELLSPLTIASIGSSAPTISPHIVLRGNERLQRIRWPRETGLFRGSISGRGLTISDLARVGAMLGGLTLPPFISPAAFDLFYGPVIPVPPTYGSPMREQTPRAFGRGLAHYETTVGSNGTVLGSTCAIRFDPAAGTGVAVAMNAWQPGLRDFICERLLEAMAGQPTARTSAPNSVVGEQIQALAGRYTGLMLGLGTADVRTDEDEIRIILTNENRDDSTLLFKRTSTGELEQISNTVEGLPIGIGWDGENPFLQVGASAYGRSGS